MIAMVCICASIDLSQSAYTYTGLSDSPQSYTGKQILSPFLSSGEDNEPQPGDVTCSGLINRSLIQRELPPLDTEVKCVWVDSEIRRCPTFHDNLWFWSFQTEAALFSLLSTGLVDLRIMGSTGISVFIFIFLVLITSPSFCPLFCIFKFHVLY